MMEHPQLLQSNELDKKINKSTIFICFSNMFFERSILYLLQDDYI